MSKLGAVLLLAVIAIGVWKLVASRTHEPPPPSNVVPRFHEAWTPSREAPRSQPLFDRFAKCMGDSTDRQRSFECACEGDFARSKNPAGTCTDYLANHARIDALPPEDQKRELLAPAAADVVIPTMSVISFMRSCERAGDPTRERVQRCACRVDFMLEHVPDHRTYSSNDQLLSVIETQVAASDRYCE
jgi:hypothetical protein